MIFLLAFAVFALAGAAFLIGEIATLPARQRSLSIRRAATYGQQGAALRRPARRHCVSGYSCGSANGLHAGRFAPIRARASTRSQASSSPPGHGPNRHSTGSGSKSLLALGGLFFGMVIGSAGRHRRSPHGCAVPRRHRLPRARLRADDQGAQAAREDRSALPDSSTYSRSASRRVSGSTVRSRS